MTDGDGSGETATKQVTFYLTPTEHERLKREAEESAASLSAYCASVFREKWGREETERVAADLNAEERIEEVATQATEEIEETVEQVEHVARNLNEIHARAATYPIVNFYAMKREFDLPEAWINDQFPRARDRLRGEIPDPDGDGDGDDVADGEIVGNQSLRDRLGRDDETTTED